MNLEHLTILLLAVVGVRALVDLRKIAKASKNNKLHPRSDWWRI